MKKVVILLCVISLLGGCFRSSEVKEKTDAQKFKEEYESLNREHVKVDIKEDNPMVYANEEDIIQILKEGTGIIYFGFPTCPWCRNAIQVLIEAAQEKKINTIYYLNVLDIRDKVATDEDGNVLYHEDGSVKYTYQGTKGYQQIVEQLKDQLSSYEGVNDPNIKRIYVPDVFFIKNGTVIGHHSDTVESHKNGTDPLTEEQQKELKKIYSKLIDDLYKYDTCDEKC